MKKPVFPVSGPVKFMIMPDNYMSLREHLRNRVLYKALSSKDVPAVLGGSVKLGTLCGFRDQERHPSDIGDEYEGRQTLVTPVFVSTLGLSPEESADVKELEEQGIYLSNCLIERNVLIDGYVLCTSTSMTKSMLSMYADRGVPYDAVVKIRDAAQLLDACINWLMDRDLAPSDIRAKDADYIERVEWPRGDAPDPNPFAKRRGRFEWQREFRFFFGFGDLKNRVPAFDPIRLSDMSLIANLYEEVDIQSLPDSE